MSHFLSDGELVSKMQEYIVSGLAENTVNDPTVYKLYIGFRSGFAYLCEGGVVV